ncbi:MAG: hypothetical protein KZQ91_09520 [Candidatus Thiodiazotropha sp. (ex Lucinoma borealis)]|nr:hypothetical protein [Candidatus Thiodiazotropha sp. (ex Lucinoma borealis)]
MARHLSLRDVDAIVSLIHGWSETKLTWEAICEAAEALVGKRPTRQSLNAHEAITTAYKVVKKGLRDTGPKNPRPGSLKTAAARIAKLERERDQVKEENRAYKQLFVVWQYNAYKHGLKEYQLNAPLPQIDRERTDGEKR